ncbi:hypothetical protein [Verrucosispora sioxanthis]|nr:hypothetical protein [Verrucosispora sioxanthis]
MTNMSGFRRVDQGAEFHRLLSRVVGYAPDAVFAEARSALAEGRLADTARAICRVASAAGLRPTDAEIALLVTAAPEASAELLDIQPGEWPLPSIEFFPTHPEEDEVFAPEPAPPILDLTDAPDAFVESVTDDIDEGAVAAVDGIPGAVALWRAWRAGGYGGSTDLFARVFVLATDLPEDELPVATALLQEKLILADADETLVEAFILGQELAPYQQQALEGGALLWTAAEPRRVTIARVFDGADPETGPWFAPDHPRLEGPIRDQAIAYLSAGQLVLAITQRTADIVTGSDEPVVPMSYRTDGQWVWTDAVVYYLQTHAVAPDQDLLDHMRSVSFSPPQTDEIGTHRALAALFRPSAVLPATVG